MNTLSNPFQCRDSWAGSGGHTGKPCSVEALGGIKCRKTLQDCQGIWICGTFDTSVWNEYERWEHDDEEYKRIFESRCKMNEQEQTTAIGKAAV